MIFGQIDPKIKNNPHTVSHFGNIPFHYQWHLCSQSKKGCQFLTKNELTTFLSTFQSNGRLGQLISYFYFIPSDFFHY